MSVRERGRRTSITILSETTSRKDEYTFGRKRGALLLQ